ncbi:ubiquitin-related domain-containing protein [Fimicolochytrium jonesii]|uniref:ubiquitin-related domain-containing protein n=1 Tax=Fimicolochytrium jonesii TaxID=1396493 RepID=UPI0022FE3265|nr:ubiquitin-related domain-containing protein [Fimicolochytrium jonesii]KAI8824108.1 ubiquitin-related domain-containing protein [Fimicolochytrium jonesii]
MADASVENTQVTDGPSIEVRPNALKEGPPVVVNDRVPNNKVNLRFLLISGRRTDLLFDPTATVDFVRSQIFEAWPGEWADEKPESPQGLRVLHQGKFFEPATTLASQKLEPGQTVVVHLLLRPGANTEPEEKPRPAAGVDGVARACACCTVL